MDGNQNSEMAKQAMVDAIQSSGVDPTEFVRLGQMAEQVVGNRQLYPSLVQEVVNSGLMQKSDDTGEINYQMLVSLVALGRVAKEMSQTPMRMQ